MKLNIGSLQPFNERKYLYIVSATILAAVLLMASIGPSMLASASDDDGEIGWSAEIVATEFAFDVLPAIVAQQDVTFTGDVTAFCNTELAFALRADGDTFDFWSLYTCQTTIDGKSGTVVFLLTNGVGLASAGTTTWNWEIIEALGELVGMEGKGTGSSVLTGTVPGTECFPGAECPTFDASFLGEIEFENDDDSDSD